MGNRFSYPTPTNEKIISYECVRIVMLLRSMGLGELPENSLLLIEEDLGGIKSIFLQTLVLDFLKNGKKAMYISTRKSAEDILEEIKFIRSIDGSEMKNLTLQGDFKSRESFIEICKSFFAQKDIKPIDICVVDTFSYLFMEENLHNLNTNLSLFLNTARRFNVTFFLASDVGLLQEREERLLRSMADGVIQFKTEYAAGKINRYINIPKMRNVSPIERLIPFKIKEGNIVPDTRERIG